MTHDRAVPRTVLAAALVLPVLASVAVGAGPAVAAEQAPPAERTAWFSAASGGGLAVPQPTTGDGDLRVTRTTQVQAFTTLLFRGEGVRASLDVTLREGTAAGTPDVVACPTVGADWEPGGNQPLETAPEVDCGASTSFAVRSEDGGVLSFALDGAFQVEPGTWSIALVPAPGGVSPGPPPSVPLPFTLDLVPPEPGDFVLQPAFAVPDLTDDTGQEAFPTGSGAPSDGFGDGGSSDGSSGLADVLGFPGLDAVTGGDDAALGAPVDPALAAVVDDVALPSVPGAVTPAFPPALQARPAGVADDLTAGRRLLALLVLAGGSAAVGYAAGQQRPGPRLLGGRARALGVPALAGGVAVPAGGAAAERPRGIGRFAKQRDAAPRRLR